MRRFVMGQVVAPRSLRSFAAIDFIDEMSESRSVKAASAVAGLIAVREAEARVAPSFWLQSMVRDDHARSLVFDLDTAIQALAQRLGRDDPETVKLTGIYHNLIRDWAEV
jgi:hypothetical protein